MLYPADYNERVTINGLDGVRGRGGAKDGLRYDDLYLFQERVVYRLTYAGPDSDPTLWAARIESRSPGCALSPTTSLRNGSQDAMYAFGTLRSSGNRPAAQTAGGGD